MLGAFIYGFLCPVASWLGGESAGVPSPVIETEPSNVVNCAGAATAMRCRALGDGVVYRWQREAAPRVWVDLQSDADASPTTGLLITSNPDGSSSLMFNALGLDRSGKYRCIIENAEGSGVVSRSVFATALAGDVAGPAGESTPDGEKDNNDLIGFIDAFFMGRAWADMGQTGGESGGDGEFDANDFVVFVRTFFDDCFALTNPVQPVPETPLTPHPSLD